MRLPRVFVSFRFVWFVHLFCSWEQPLSSFSFFNVWQKENILFTTSHYNEFMTGYFFPLLLPLLLLLLFVFISRSRFQRHIFPFIFIVPVRPPTPIHCIIVCVYGSSELALVRLSRSFPLFLSVCCASRVPFLY